LSDCLFCKIANGEIPAKLVYEDDHAVAFSDINPQAPTHVLVIPRRHITGFAALTPADGETLGYVAAAVNQVAKELTGGYRVVVNNGDDAGQTVHHIHFHVLGGRKMTWPPG
jgi:histidine triad (HIT) family protein